MSSRKQKTTTLSLTILKRKGRVSPLFLCIPPCSAGLLSQPLGPPLFGGRSFSSDISSPPLCHPERSSPIFSSAPHSGASGCVVEGPWQHVMSYLIRWEPPRPSRSSASLPDYWSLITDLCPSIGWSTYAGCRTLRFQGCGFFFPLSQCGSAPPPHSSGAPRAAVARGFFLFSSLSSRPEHAFRVPCAFYRDGRHFFRSRRANVGHGARLCVPRASPGWRDRGNT